MYRFVFNVLFVSVITHHLPLSPFSKHKHQQYTITKLENNIFTYKLHVTTTTAFMEKGVRICLAYKMSGGLERKKKYGRSNTSIEDKMWSRVRRLCESGVCAFFKMNLLAKHKKHDVREILCFWRLFKAETFFF